MSDTDTSTSGNQPRKAGAFDVRSIIAALIGFYGVVLVLTGLLATSAADLELAGGLNINLYAGIGMIVFAAAFLLWVRLRPLVIPGDSVASEGADGAGQAPSSAGH